MGQKINPIGFRLAVNRNWSSRWYASTRAFAGMLADDIKVRAFLKKKLAHASVGRVVIERLNIVKRHSKPRGAASPGGIVEKEAPNGDVVARSRFHMLELRRDDVRHFAGSYVHHLKKTAHGYRIKLQRVDMTNAQAAYDYVLQVWV